MLWFCLGALALLLGFAAYRAKQMGPLLADAHLEEVAALLPDLKARALAGEEGEGASARTSGIAIGYRVEREGGKGWVHRLTVSSPISSAPPAGTFFLGLARSLLGLAASPPEVFVAEGHVYTLVVRLNDKEQRAYAAREVEAPGAAALRGMGIEGRAALMPRLVSR
jgi:hypothetical protein